MWAKKKILLITAPTITIKTVRSHTLSELINAKYFLLMNIYGWFFLFLSLAHSLSLSPSYIFLFFFYSFICCCSYRFVLVLFPSFAHSLARSFFVFSSLLLQIIRISTFYSLHVRTRWSRLTQDEIVTTTTMNMNWCGLCVRFFFLLSIEFDFERGQCGMHMKCYTDRCVMRDRKGQGGKKLQPTQGKMYTT